MYPVIHNTKAKMVLPPLRSTILSISSWPLDFVLRARVCNLVLYLPCGPFVFLFIFFCFLLLYKVGWQTKNRCFTATNCSFVLEQSCTKIWRPLPRMQCAMTQLPILYWTRGTTTINTSRVPAREEVVVFRQVWGSFAAVLFYYFFYAFCAPWKTLKTDRKLGRRGSPTTKFATFCSESCAHMMFFLHMGTWTYLKVKTTYGLSVCCELQRRRATFSSGEQKTTCSAGSRVSCLAKKEINKSSPGDFCYPLYCFKNVRTVKDS